MFYKTYWHLPQTPIDLNKYERHKKRVFYEYYLGLVELQSVDILSESVEETIENDIENATTIVREKLLTKMVQQIVVEMALQPPLRTVIAPHTPPSQLLLPQQQQHL